MSQDNSEAGKKIAVSTYDMFFILNGIRTAVNLGVSSLTLLSNLRTSSSTELAGTEGFLFNRQTVLTTFMTVEFAHFAFATSYLFMRNCLLDHHSLKDPSSQNVQMLHSGICLGSLVSGILLAIDLEGESLISTAGVVLMVLTTALANTVTERFENRPVKPDDKENKPKQPLLYRFFGSPSEGDESDTNDQDKQSKHTTSKSTATKSDSSKAHQRKGAKQASRVPLVLDEESDFRDLDDESISATIGGASK